ncbi:MAG: AraC family transcriptional regulator [Calditrichaeota bacterium]|nr:MAG: AraC family transcriptional regulator [Calditrichota bacterium]MBL1207437.1 AraC family transcriptional regulator [Calditrichota bacterium]
MNLQFDLLAIINTLGAFQCFLISLALFSLKTGNRTANRYLAFFLLTLSLFIFDEILYNSGLYQYYPYTYGIGTTFDFLLPPFLYLYIKALTVQDYTLKKKEAIHFVLAAIILLLSLPGIFQSSAIKSAAYLNDLQENLNLGTFEIVFSLVFQIYIGSYFVTALVKLNSALNNEALDKDIPVKFKYLRGLIIAMLFVLAVHIFFFYTPWFDETADVYLLFLLTVIVYIMAFTGMRQSEIFTADLLKINPQKYKKSTLTDEVVEKTLSNLQRLMEVEKLYLNSDLKLPDLASQLKVTTHQLSQIINEKFEKNFFNFINEYRIEAVKSILNDPASENRTMPDIAFEVGFNSLSVFNSAFKKVTGLSPSEFRKQS